MQRIEKQYFLRDPQEKKKPYLRRVYKDNALKIEQGLRDSVDNLSYEERYIYRYDELGHPSGTPSTTFRTIYDEKGNEQSLTIIDKGKGVTKYVEYGPQEKLSAALGKRSKQGALHNMHTTRPGKGSME